MDTSALLDFILGLLSDEGRAAAFENDPEGMLADAGFAGLTCGDIDAVMPAVADFAPAGVHQHQSVGAGGGGGGADVSAIQQLQYIVSHYAWIDVEDNSFEQNIWAGGDVNQAFDGGIAVGDDLDNEDGVINTGNGAVVAGDDQIVLDPIVTGDDNIVGDDNEVVGGDNIVGNDDALINTGAGDVNDNDNVAIGSGNQDNDNIAIGNEDNDNNVVGNEDNDNNVVGNDGNVIGNEDNNIGNDDNTVIDVEDNIIGNDDNVIGNDDNNIDNDFNDIGTDNDAVDVDVELP